MSIKSQVIRDLCYNFFMFYFDNLHGRKILRSDLFEHGFFTTREGIDFDRLDPKRIVTPVQTHSDNVEFVDERNEYPGTDGLIITDKNDVIYLKFADCTPLIFYDQKQKIAAVSHAGWRGTASKIGVKTIRKMNSNPKDIIAVIGPAISICCYEVSFEVREELLETVNDKSELYNNRHVDLKRINARQLEEIGVEKIDICPYCTSCNNDLFYSYRKENKTTSRHYAVAIL